MSRSIGFLLVFGLTFPLVEVSAQSDQFSNTGPGTQYNAPRGTITVNPSHRLGRTSRDDAKPLIGSWQGVYACKGSEGSLEWVIDVFGDQIQVRERSNRRIFGILVPGQKSYRGSWIYPKLILTYDGFPSYRIDLKLVDPGHLRGEYYDHGTCDAVDLTKTQQYPQ